MVDRGEPTVRSHMSQSKDEIRARAWAEVRDLLELQLTPLGRPALDALAATPAAHILDIGCGGGTTTLEIAKSVGPTGTVCGVDISASVLAYAKAAADGCERVRFVQADAQSYPFEQHCFDGAFSRFGVMFFADPVAAFINIRRSIKPKGRLAFVCWRTLEENPLDILPLRAAIPYIPPQPPEDPDAPGPFSLADAARTGGILERAGFADVEIKPRDTAVGSGSLDAMLAVCSRVGALGKILREQPELCDAVLPVLRSALSGFDGPDGVKLNAATWVVTARA
jgi:SAM-dependent methyltransferase